MNWSEPIRIESRGRRIFQEIGGLDRWAIADNTGPTPETTESGILWIETKMSIRIDMGPAGGQGLLCVWSQRYQRGTRIAIKIEGALFLVKQLNMKVEFASALDPLISLVKLAHP